MHEVTITIRWRDVDNYGHVNNAVYLTYLEECRDRLVEFLFGTEEAWDFVLARVAIDYRNQLTQADGQVGCDAGSPARDLERADLGADREARRHRGRRVRGGDRSQGSCRRAESRPLTDEERAILRAATEEPS